MYVNASDYMATTEATGIRMAVNVKGEFPFPETFGYSAPTGYISSFPMRMASVSIGEPFRRKFFNLIFVQKRVNRLPEPYGTCVREGNLAGYVYKDYAYTVEVLNSFQSECFGVYQ